MKGGKYRFSQERSAEGTTKGGKEGEEESEEGERGAG